MESPKRVFKKNYLVVVMDMYNYGESYDHSDYYTFEEALAVAKEVILSSFSKRGQDGYDEWMMFGESASIVPINGAPKIPKFQSQEFSSLPELPKFQSQEFVRSICGLYTYDFTDLDNETIKHPDFPNYQPTDGELYVIRTMIKDKKMKRIRALLDPEIANLEFLDVEGVAVTLIKDGKSANLTGYCLAWNHKGGRSFPGDSARRNGGPIDYQDFLKLYESDLTEQIQKSWLRK